MSLYRLPVSRWSEYVLDAESNPIVRSVNSPAGRALATDKFRFHQRLVGLGVPSIPVLGLIGSTNNPGIQGSGDEFLSHYDFVNVIAASNDRLFIKPTFGSHGTGAFVASKDSDKWSFEGVEGYAADLFNHCLRATNEGTIWIVQPVLKAHRAIAEAVSPRALGTVRVVTLLVSGNVEVLAAVLKMPVGDNPIDNFGEGATGNIAAPVDIESGILGPGVTTGSRSWPEIVVVDRHPDTGRRIEGFQLPCWTELLDVVKKAQAGIPEAPTLGWDMAIADEGPVVVEANAGYGANILQVAYQRGLRGLLSKAHSLPRWQSAAASERRSD
jgi:hypothetical protein